MENSSNKMETTFVYGNKLSMDMLNTEEKLESFYDEHICGNTPDELTKLDFKYLQVFDKAFEALYGVKPLRLCCRDSFIPSFQILKKDSLAR